MWSCFLGDVKYGSEGQERSQGSEKETSGLLGWEYRSFMQVVIFQTESS